MAVKLHCQIPQFMIKILRCLTNRLVILICRALPVHIVLLGDFKAEEPGGMGCQQPFPSTANGKGSNEVGFGVFLRLASDFGGEVYRAGGFLMTNA